MSVPVVVVDRDRELHGVVREGESWAAAARRTCASLHVEPEPLDLLAVAGGSIYKRAIPAAVGVAVVAAVIVWFVARR